MTVNWLEMSVSQSTKADYFAKAKQFNSFDQKTEFTKSYKGLYQLLSS